MVESTVTGGLGGVTTFLSGTTASIDIFPSRDLQQHLEMVVSVHLSGKETLFDSKKRRVGITTNTIRRLCRVDLPVLREQQMRNQPLPKPVTAKQAKCDCLYTCGLQPNQFD